MKSDNNTYAVEVSGLSKRFGSFAALSDVAFNMKAGSTVALLGPSGCGKTTILRCLAGLEQPNDGTIRIGGKPVYAGDTGVSLPPERRNVGVVFQSYAIWPHMSVAENVGFPLRIRGRPKSEIETEVNRMLEMVGLQASAKKMATQLSGGQQQRVAIARALISKPTLMLFDEALSNLDAQMRDQMRMELKVLQEKVGFTALYVTHDQTEAFALAEHVIVMNRGTIETTGDPEDVFANPSSPFVAQFMGLNMMQGTGAADAHGECTVMVGGNVLRGQVAAGENIGIGSPAVACIRKEHLAFDFSEQSVSDDVNVIEGEIIASSFLGLQREYLVRFGSTEVKVVSQTGGLEVSQKVKLQCRKNDVIFFASK